MKRILFSIGLLILVMNSFAQKTRSFSELSELVDNAKLKKDFFFADSIAKDYINNYLLKLKINELMKKDYLSFISHNLGDTDSQGFKFFMKEHVKINEILGSDKAEYAIRYAIAKQFIPDETTWINAKPNWNSVEKTIASKFGTLGLEAVYGRRMLYCMYTKDWTVYGKYYKLYFESALTRPEYIVNSVTWKIFENVSDTTILTFACDMVMKYAIEQWYQSDFNAYDTYANLLYKLGRKNEAVKWEERAVKLSMNDKEIIENFEKMKNNIVTWKETANN